MPHSACRVPASFEAMGTFQALATASAPHCSENVGCTGREDAELDRKNSREEEEMRRQEEEEEQRKREEEDLLSPGG